MNVQEALDHLYLRATDKEYWAKYGDDEKARDKLQNLINAYEIVCEELVNLELKDDFRFIDEKIRRELIKRKEKEFLSE